MPMNNLYCIIPTIALLPFSTSKPLYDESGRLVSDQTDRCDCNRLKCPGCFLPCTNCQSAKCGLECRKHYEISISKLDFYILFIY